ncbi:MAG TPA: efflux RND transporter periplasmic adaptor subunit, partial [Candidatus Binatia bacterium]|nr:efflux RND transporter periplasmic adaptor subunit [Candidatus Binatia bacterium]
MRNKILKIIPTSLLPTALVIALLSGCEQSSPPAQQPTTLPTVNVQTVRAHQGEIARSITLPTFKLLPWQEATLYAKVAGYLKTLNVDIGDSVTQGELLATIEVPEMLAERPKYEAEVGAADADYRRVRDARQKAPDLVMPQTVDNAKAKLDAAKANLDQLETMLSYAKITAPFSGVVTKRRVDPGAFIPAATSSSAVSDAAVLTLMDSSTVRVQVAVPGSEALLIKDGLPAQVDADALPGRVFKGSVTRYAHSLDEATKTLLTEV